MNAIRIPGIPEDSRFAYEPEANRIVPVADLKPGDRFLHRQSRTVRFELVEVVRIETLHRTGSSRIWARREGRDGSPLPPFDAGTYDPDALVPIPR